MLQVDLPGFAKLRVHYNCRTFEIYSIIVGVCKLGIDQWIRAIMPKLLQCDKLSCTTLKISTSWKENSCALHLKQSKGSLHRF